MINENSKIRLNVDRFLSYEEKKALIEEIKSEYGVKSVRINDISKSKTHQGVSVIADTLNNEVALNSKYEKYLKDKHFDRELFQEIDQEVLSYIPDLKEDYKKNYSIKYIKGKNILSYGSFEFDLFGLDGINVVYSDPENFGGKTNFYKLFQILLWGEYMGVGVKSKIDAIPNKFLKQNAFIEGIIQVEDKSYFLRRDYSKRSTKYSHSFNLFLLVDENQADCFFISDETGVTSIDVNSYNPSLEGFFAKNLNTKNSSESKKLFSEEIGTLDEFISNCYFDQLNINSLLLEKPAKRTREFYNLFGGKYFEAKKEVAKNILYKKFKEKSVVHHHNVTDIKKEISVLDTELVDLESQRKVLVESIDSSTQQLEEINKEKELLIFDLKEEFFYDKDELLQKQNIKENERINLDSDINKMSVSLNFVYTDAEYQNFKKEQENINNKIIHINASKGLVDELDDLSRDFKESTVISEIKKKLEELNDQKISLKVKYKTLKLELDAVEVSLNELDQPFLCPHCNKEINNSTSTKEKYDGKKRSILNELNQIKEKSYDLVDLEKKLLDQLSEIEKDYESKISNVKAKIEEDVREQRNQLTSSLKDIQAKIDECNRQKEIANLIAFKKNKLQLLDNELNDIKKQLRLIEKNKDIIEHNKKTQKKIIKKTEEVNEINKVLKTLNQRLSVLVSDMARKQLLLDQHNDLLKRLSDDIQKDAAYSFYINAHDKNGIIKDIISSYLNEINLQLKEPLTTMHFDVEIKQVKDVIEYFKIDKKTGVTMLLSEASNFERFVSISALHLIRLKYSTSVLSNIMFFDEVFAQTHDINVPILYSSLEQYKDIFQIVMVISHRNSVKKLADNEIKIAKENNVSTIEKY